MKSLILRIKNSELSAEAKAEEDNKALLVLSSKDWAFGLYNDIEGYIVVELCKGSRIKLSSIAKLLPAYSVSSRS